jgi:hypothetical protein
MSGGFLNSLAIWGPRFADAIAGYEAIGLRDAAQLVRKARAALPAKVLPPDHDQTAALIDALPDGDAAVLERLGDEYQELFPTDEILFEALETAGRQ